MESDSLVYFATLSKSTPSLSISKADSIFPSCLPFIRPSSYIPSPKLHMTAKSPLSFLCQINPKIIMQGRNLFTGVLWRFEHQIKQIYQLVLDFAVSQIDKNDAHEVIILTRFLIAVQQMLFFQLIVVDRTFPLWGFHADPNGIDLLYFIVVAIDEFGPFLRRNQAAGIIDSSF